MDPARCLSAWERFGPPTVPIKFFPGLSLHRAVSTSHAMRTLPLSRTLFKTANGSVDRRLSQQSCAATALIVARKPTHSQNLGDGAVQEEDAEIALDI